MKIEEKLKKTSRNSIIARTVILMIMLYFLMIVVKSVYFLTEGNSLNPLTKINEIMRWIIENTYFTPLNFIWDKIPSTLIESGDPFLYYKVIVPPMAILFICIFFIDKHRSLKNKYQELKNEIEKEKILHDMRKDAGINTVSESATLDIIISDRINSNPSWHNTWWGKVVIGILIALILVGLGLK